MSFRLTKFATALALFFTVTNIHANDAFFTNLQSLCGETFEGEMSFPTDALDGFSGKRLVAKIATCNDNTIAIPFHVGEDHSRTWLISKTKDGLLLKHEHRHHDGSFDEVSNYGGYADQLGSKLTQSFPADEFTQKLIPEAATNVWSISVSKDSTQLTYHLERHQKPRFTATLSRQN